MRTNSEALYVRACVGSHAMAGEFDFWLGEWDARWDGGRGTNVVTSELDGAVILERFDGRPGTDLQGISVSVQDGGTWRQTWVDSQHGYLDFSGGMREGVMELHHERDVDGERARFRMRFTEIASSSFVWFWERLVDDTWEERWRIDYTRRR
jgi:hypothetical protein